MSRPSLKITRHDDQDPPGDFSFEVWNPISGNYEPKDSLDAGLFRMGELSEQVRLMWAQHDPAKTSLKEAPEPAENDASEWAELRVSARVRQVYGTRNFDQQEWRQARSKMAAVQTTCNEVGYVPS